MERLNKAATPLLTKPGWAPFALGFRPFFLLAGFAGLVLIGIWPVVWRGRLAIAAHYDPIAWHGHEMLFGYTAAVIAGFLLTAVRNWTGVDTWTGGRLALLAVTWLLGRLLPWVDGIPAALLIAVDVAFLPLLAVSLVVPLWQGKARINRVFVPLLVAMALANLLSHLQLLGMLPGVGDMRRVMVVLVLLIIAIVGGRVMPFFTQSVLPGFRPVRRKWVEGLTMTGLVVIAVLQTLPLVPVPAPTLAALWIALGLLQLIRAAGWFDWRVFRIPVLWVLHVAYAWVALGALLTGLAELGLFARASALHALTVGGIGVFTIGMMARVARGHTGRPIDVVRSMILAFVMMNMAALLRVFGTAWLGFGQARWIDLSSALWSLGFALFLAQYVPILLRARVDGRPG